METGCTPVCREHWDDLVPAGARNQGCKDFRYVYISLSLYIYIYIYIYIYTYTYTSISISISLSLYIYIYIYIRRFSKAARRKRYEIVETPVVNTLNIYGTFLPQHDFDYSQTQYCRAWQLVRRMFADFWQPLTYHTGHHAAETDMCVSIYPHSTPHHTAPTRTRLSGPEKGSRKRGTHKGLPFSYLTSNLKVT